MNRTFAALALACLISPATVAQEHTTGLLTMRGSGFAETVTANVQTADLDLSRDADRHKLAKRLRFAMQNICGPIPSNNAPRLQRAYAACKTSLTIDAASLEDPVKANAMTVALNNLD